MRVLHTEWSTGWGGQEIRILAEMRGVRDRGVEVILATRPGAKIRPAAEAQGFRVFELPFVRSFDPVTIARLWRLIRRERIDVVNTHSGKDTWNGGLAAKLAGAAFVRTRHLYFAPGRFQLLWINRLADYVATTGEVLRARMIEDSGVKPDRIASVPTGQDAGHFDPARLDRAKERERFGIRPGQLAVGMMALFRGVKGVHQFLRMARTLAARHPELVFLVAGDGVPAVKQEMQEFIEREGLAERVLRPGFQEDTAPFLAALDIFVLPSLMEGLPQALIQALMMERACVSTEVGSVRDLYKDNFLIVPPGDVEQLTAAVELLVHDRTLAGELAARAREPTVARFGYGRMVDDMIAIYRRVAPHAAP